MAEAIHAENLPLFAGYEDGQAARVVFFDDCTGEGVWKGVVAP